MSSDLTAAKSVIEMKRGTNLVPFVIIKSPVYGGTDKIASFAIGVKSDDSVLYRFKSTAKRKLSSAGCIYIRM